MFACHFVACKNFADTCTKSYVCTYVLTLSSKHSTASIPSPVFIHMHVHYECTTHLYTYICVPNILLLPAMVLHVHTFASYCTMFLQIAAIWVSTGNSITIPFLQTFRREYPRDVQTICEKVFAAHRCALMALHNSCCFQLMQLQTLPLFPSCIRCP